MKFIHVNSNLILGEKIIKATSYWQRLRGYIFYVNPKQKFNGIFFPNNKAAQSFFVNFPIDIVFLNKKMEIVKLLPNFRPWSFSKFYFKGDLLELQE